MSDYTGKILELLETEACWPNELTRRIVQVFNADKKTESYENIKIHTFC